MSSPHPTPDQKNSPQETSGSTKQYEAPPKFIDLDKWEDTGFEWSNKSPADAFTRLAELLDDRCDPGILSIEMTLYQTSNVLHLSFQVAGRVWLTCQRCLQPVDVDLTDSYDIALLDNDSQISLLDDEQDYVLLSEVVHESGVERLLPVKTIIEDELLLKTPMAPKHDDCEMAVEQVGDIPQTDNDNPFAKLAKLKGKL